MSADAVREWEEKVAELHRNRRHRVPKDWRVEDALTQQLEGIHARLTKKELSTVTKPVPPVKPDLIAHDSDGHLIGYEECHCPKESIPAAD